MLAASGEGADGELVEVGSVAKVAAEVVVGFGVLEHEVAGLEVVERRGLRRQGVETCAEVGVFGEEGGYFEFAGNSAVPGGGGLASRVGGGLARMEQACRCGLWREGVMEGGWCLLPWHELSWPPGRSCHYRRAPHGCFS